jgi:hypothetical protein
MSVTHPSRRIMEQTIMTLCGISDVNPVLLSRERPHHAQPRRYFEDILPDAVFMDRKKLVHAGRSISWGETVTGTPRTLAEIVLYLNTPVTGPSNPGSPGPPLIYTPYPNRGKPKLCVNSLAISVANLSSMRLGKLSQNLPSIRRYMDNF